MTISSRIAVAALHLAPICGCFNISPTLRKDFSQKLMPLTQNMKMSTQSTALIGRAVVIRKNGGPEVLELVPNFSFPPPAQDEVLIKTAAFGVNFADVIIRNGIFGPIPESPTVRSGACFCFLLCKFS